LATSTFTVAPSNSSDAYFRGWGGALSTAIQAVGVTKTTDTGQVNWTTATAPAAINTKAGYEIYKFTDTLSATYPVFIRIDYGSASSTNNPAIWITVGTGTNGAGTITGTVIAATQIGTASSSTTAYVSRVSGDTNRLSFVTWDNFAGATYLIGVGIERSRNYAGTETGTGVLCLFLNGTGATKISQFGTFGVTTTQYANWNTSTPPSGTGALAPDTNFYPVRGWRPGETSPSLNFLSFISGDAAFNSSYSVVCFDGVTRTFVTPVNSNAVIAVGFGGTNYAMMRYD